MPKVAVVTDSCASSPEKLRNALDIRWVAYYIHRGQEVLRDLVTSKTDELCRGLDGHRGGPRGAGRQELRGDRRGGAGHDPADADDPDGGHAQVSVHGRAH